MSFFIDEFFRMINTIMMKVAYIKSIIAVITIRIDKCYQA